MDDATARAAKPQPSPMNLPGGYRPAHNPVLMLDPQGNTVDWSNGDHVRAFATALAVALTKRGVVRS